MVFGTLQDSDITLRPLTAADYDALFAVGADAAIWAQHPDRERYTPEGFRFFFQKLLETDMPYLVIDRATESVIGATSYYQYDAAARQVAIGYTFLATRYWGGATNRQVKSMLLNHAFQYVDTVIFHVREHNYRSQAALVKLGAQKVNTYPAPADPQTMQLEYAIRKSHWLGQL